jgi:hypothetical protein
MKGASASAKGKEQEAGSSVRGNRRRQEDQGKGNVQSRSKASPARRKDEEAPDQVAQEEVGRIDPYVVEYAVLARYVSAYVAEHDARFKNSTGRLFKKTHEIGFSGTYYLAQESGVSYDQIRKLVKYPHVQRFMTLGIADEILAAMEMTYLIAGDDPEIPVLPNPRCPAPPKNEEERLARLRERERAKWYRSHPEIREKNLKSRRARARKVRLERAQAV